MFSPPTKFKSEVKDKYDTFLTRKKVKEINFHSYTNILCFEGNTFTEEF